MSGLSSSNAAKDIFLAAIELKSTGDRIAYLNHACGDDNTLRQRVEELIAAHERPESLLNRCAPVVAPSSPNETVALENSELCGSQIGPYKILQMLGEGGMGLVYLAEQQRPVRRQVALKIIKHGMDSKKFIARFEAERQALAMMDHPNIAQVLEAGCTDKGRPFFVMELVKGVPISDFCDENRLTTRERLELFVQVCQAVHHAHQKGIIHRDIKPSNVLVALYDQKPVPKVIDFGVAKATSQQLTEKTLFTEVGSILGTWEYMSPEQAVLNQLDVDTRTDVYSLGVLLYELLTGETPLDRHRLREAQIMETLRLIREEEPPKPSTRISSLGQRATATAAYRKTKPESLASEIRGDLDWIVMKALAKERSRRYDSASRLGEDIGRYLKNELVEARPPSTWYQMQKQYARNRGLFNAVAFAFGVLAIALTFSLYFWNRASTLASELQVKTQELRSNQERLSIRNEALQRAFVDRAISDSISGNFHRAELSIEQAAEAGAAPSFLAAISGLARYFSGDVAEALVQLREATVHNPESIEAWAVLYLAAIDAGEYEYMGEARQHLLLIEPKTSTERMLRAMTTLWAEPSIALDEFSQLLKDQEHSPILRVLRAIALREAAMAYKSRTRLDESLQEFERVNTLLPENRFVQAQYLETISNAIRLANSELGVRGREHVPDCAALSATATGLLRSLEGDSGAERFSRLHRATYYAVVGDRAAYEGVTAKGNPGQGNMNTAQIQSRAAKLFASRDYSALRDFLEKHGRWSSGIYNAFMRIDQATTAEDRLSIAQESFDNVYQDHEYAFGNDVLALEVFLVAGDIDALIENAKRVQKKPVSFEWYQYDRTLELFIDPTDRNISEYIENAEPFSGTSSYANWVAGLFYLARNDRTLAKACFQRAVDAGKFDWWSHVWAEAFLSRIEDDKNWPQWMALGASTSQG